MHNFSNVYIFRGDINNLNVGDIRRDIPHCIGRTTTTQLVSVSYSVSLLLSVSYNVVSDACVLCIAGH